MDDELLDLVDANDTVTGTINRKDYQRLLTEELGYIRAAELFIVNSEGKIWVPVRTLHKTIAPGGYDYSAAGHVEAGSDYLQTVIREAKEEIDTDVAEQELELVAKLQSDSDRYIRSVYLLRSNVTPRLNSTDFVSGSWMTPGELLENIANGHPAKASLGSTVLKLQEYLQAKV